MDNADNRKLMIRLQNVSKDYQIGQIGYGTLNRDLQSWWARVRHKPDPNSKLGTDKRLVGDMIHALNGVNLTVYQGERVGIIGGNGAGKSTMLKLISRVAAPTSGSLDLYGRITSMLEVGTGFHGEMTGRENIYLNGTILGMSRKEIDNKLEQIIEFSEVRDFIDTPVKRYSSGMYVKLAFSVAAHLDSQIVIMDEVLAVGDEAFQKKCITKMRDVAADENRTILYVSHNMATVRALCDRCIVLSEGKLIYDGNVEEAIGSYRSFLLSKNGKKEGISSIIRRDKNLSGLCKMQDIHLEEETVSGDEGLGFRLRIRAEECLPDVRLRVMVSNGYGQLIGMTSSNGFPLAEGDNQIPFVLPTESFGTGGYVCDLVLFSFDGHVQVRHDFLSKVMSFRVERSQLYFGSKWTAEKWGTIRLPQIQIGALENGE